MYVHGIIGKYKNPISKAWTIELLALATGFFLLGIYLYMTTRFLDTKIFGTGVSGFLCCIFIVLFFYTQVIIKPSWVTVRSDGAVLQYRIGKERFVPWSEWKCINRSDTDVTTIKGRLNHYGRGKLKGRIAAFDLTYEIAEAMQKAYVGELKCQRIGPYVILDTTDYSRRGTRR